MVEYLAEMQAIIDEEREKRMQLEKDKAMLQTELEVAKAEVERLKKSMREKIAEWDEFKRKDNIYSKL